MSIVTGDDAVMKFSNVCEIGCATENFAAFIAASDLGRTAFRSTGFGNGVEALAVVDASSVGRGL